MGLKCSPIVSAFATTSVISFFFYGFRKKLFDMRIKLSANGVAITLVSLMRKPYLTLKLLINYIRGINTIKKIVPENGYP